MRRLLNKWFGRNYSIEKVRLAFEYGLTIANTAHEMKVEITPELVKKAEVMIEGEFSSQSETHLAGNIVPNILSVFELDINK